MSIPSTEPRHIRRLAGGFVIGSATEQVEGLLPPDAARADYERIVIITRETLVRAKADIPDS